MFKRIFVLPFDFDFDFDFDFSGDAFVSFQPDTR